MDLISWPAEMVYSQGMPAGVGGQDNGMRWRKVSWRKRSLRSIKGGVREEKKGDHSRCSTTNLG